MANHNSNRNSGITTKKAEPVSADRFVMIDGDTSKCASAGIFEQPRAARSLQERKEYCTNLLKVALRYSDEQEIISLTREVESFIAQALNSQYRPGMNAAAYHAFRQFAMTGRK